MAFIVTRIQTGDYDGWKPMFDLDGPGTVLRWTGTDLAPSPIPVAWQRERNRWA